MPPSHALMYGFIAGFLAVLIFHQGLWYLLNQMGVIPPDRSAWSIDPVPSLGVPSVLSKAFWGGLRGLALIPVLARLSGRPIGRAGRSSAQWRSRSSPSSWCRRSRARRCRRLCCRVSWSVFLSTAPGASVPRLLKGAWSSARVASGTIPC